MDNNVNVDILKGEPKVAIRKLATPTILSMLLLMIYNLVDSIWVSGIGSDALAALGFINPLFLIIVGLGSGIGAGAISAISRAIGANNKDLASNAAVHSILLTFIISIGFSIGLIISLKPILVFMGASSSFDLACDYGYKIFAFAIFFILPQVLASILRSEGNVKGPMYALGSTSILNMVLDPIFIYIFNLGINGAAWASILSTTISLLIMAYWIWIKKITYLDISKSSFHFNKAILIDISKIMIPASCENLFLAILIIILNTMLTMVSGTIAVACYSTAIKINQIAMIPSQGIGTALLTVAGASYGAKDYNKLRTAYSYSNKLGLLVSAIIVFFVILFAQYIAMGFSYTPESAAIGPHLTSTIRILNLFVLLYVLGLNSIAVFQGIGKGFSSFILTLFKSLIAQLIFCSLFTFVFNMGEFGVYLGLIVGTLVFSLTAYIYCSYYLRKLSKKIICI